MDVMADNSKAHRCQICGRQFDYLCLLKDHSNVHTGEKPHLCSECGKSFSLKGSLKQHIRTHQPSKYKCKFCNFRAKVRSDLDKHERTHTQERPYMCHVCGVGYIQSSHLSDHAKTHTGQRPNNCDLCGRGFLKKSDMTRHRKIHTGEYPFQCLNCGRMFRQSAQYANHVKKHHPETLANFSAAQEHYNNHTAEVANKTASNLHADILPQVCDAALLGLDSDQLLGSDVMLPNVMDDGMGFGDENDASQFLQNAVASFLQ